MCNKLTVHYFNNNLDNLDTTVDYENTPLDIFDTEVFPEYHLSQRGTAAPCAVVNNVAPLCKV